MPFCYFVCLFIFAVTFLFRHVIECYTLTWCISEVFRVRIRARKKVRDSGSLKKRSKMPILKFCLAKFHATNVHSSSRSLWWHHAAWKAIHQALAEWNRKWQSLWNYPLERLSEVFFEFLIYFERVYLTIHTKYFPAQSRKILNAVLIPGSGWKMSVGSTSLLPTVITCAHHCWPELIR